MINDKWVRPPDAVKRERLISSTSSSSLFIPYNEFLSEEDQLKQAIIQSELDYEMQKAIAESEMEEGRRRSKEERKKHLIGLKLRFQQFQKIDKERSDFYQRLLDYIDSYEAGHSIRIEVEDEFYSQLLRTLGNIRVVPEEKKRILALIVTSVK